MSPLGFATIVLAVILILGRGGFVFAPAATARLWDQGLFGKAERVRIFGVVVIGVLAIPLLVGARLSPDAHHGWATFLTVVGWVMGAGGALSVALPALVGRWGSGKMTKFPHEFLRAVGVLSVIFALYLIRLSFTVL